MRPEAPAHTRLGRHPWDAPHPIVLDMTAAARLGYVPGAAGLVDELCLTVAPLMGGDPLPVAVAPPGDPLARFALRHVLRSEGDDTLFLRYERGTDGP